MATWHIGCKKCKEDYYVMGDEGEYDSDEMRCGECGSNQIDLLSYDRSDHGMILMLAERIHDLDSRMDRLMDKLWPSIDDKDEKDSINDDEVNKVVH